MFILCNFVKHDKWRLWKWFAWISPKCPSKDWQRGDGPCLFSSGLLLLNVVPWTYNWFAFNLAAVFQSNFAPIGSQPCVLWRFKCFSSRIMLSQNSQGIHAARLKIDTRKICKILICFQVLPTFLFQLFEVILNVLWYFEFHPDRLRMSILRWSWCCPNKTL